MRIFISYGYGDRDRWVEQLVFPLVNAFDSTPINAKDIQGEQLTEGVRTRIDRCQALVAFATRRDQNAVEGLYRTHRWVTDELAYASQLGKLVVEVRETGVDPQGGIGGDRARINYDEANRGELMLQLTSTFARWHRQIRRVHVIPLKYVCRDGQLAEVGLDWLRRRVNQPGFRCQYQILDGDAPSRPVDIDLRFIEGRLYFNAASLASGSRLRLQITTDEGVFVSDFENVDDVNLPMPLEVSQNQLADPRPRGLEVQLR